MTDALRLIARCRWFSYRSAALLLFAAAIAGCSDDNTNPNPVTYTVGGSLTGLTAGKSVVLRNNGGDDLTLGADGAFGFPTRLASGAHYDVTVFTQPAGMTCPVTSGSGSVGAADVTSVAVACVAITTALDTAFAAGAGFATFDAGTNTDDSGNEMTLDGTGRLVVAGHSFNPATGALEMAVWRVNANGTIDGGFGSGGLVRHPGSTVTGTSTPEVIGSSVRVDGSGRVVVAGYDIDSTGTWGVAVWRFTSSGQPDATFGTGGMVRLDNPQSAGVGLALDGNGRPVVSGFAWNGSDWDAAVWRFTTDGVPDSTFNSTGFVSQNSSAGTGQAMGEDIGVGVAIDATGRIVMAGYSSNAAGNQDMTVWRYTASGTLDASFNGAGVFRHDNAGGGGGNDIGRTIAFDATNRIVVVGWSPSSGGGDDLAVWRLTAGGALDPTFNGQGFATHNGAAGGNGTDTGRDIVIDGAGRLVLVGESTNAAGDLDLAIWRYTAAGLLDPTFNGTGYFIHSGAAGGTNGNDAGRGVTIDGSNRIVVAGRSTASAGTLDMAVWRVKP